MNYIEKHLKLNKLYGGRIMRIAGKEDIEELSKLRVIQQKEEM